MKTKKHYLLHHLFKLALFIVLYELSGMIVFGQENDSLILEKYINELIVCPSDGDGMSKREVAIADSIEAFGARAVPKLIELLKHQNHKVRERASYILRTIDGVTENHLDVLIESLKMGQTWHAPRIAKIGTPKAIEALVEELIKDPKVHTQITYSFEVLGEKGLSYLFKLLECNANCDEDLLHVVSFIFKNLGHKAESYVYKLDSLALSTNNSITSRKWAIICIGNIGEATDSIAKNIYELSLKDPENFKEAATDALQSINSQWAVYPLLQRLEASKTVFEKILVLRDIAEMDGTGNLAGSAILPYLSSEDWNLRIATAITLGYIGYRPSVDSLIVALKFEPDCRLNFVSAIALGKLKSKSSLQYLNWTKENHWNPRVRHAAEYAIKQIEDTSFVVKAKKYSSFGEEFFSYEIDAMMYPWCDLDSCNKTKEFKLTNGKLVCIDHGEFGGNLRYIDTNGSDTILACGNFKTIYQIDGKLVAIAGIAHLSFNSGSIYQIDINDDRSFSVKRILSLPGAPIESNMDPFGNVIINTYGGTIKLTPNLKLELVECYP